MIYVRLLEDVRYPAAWANGPRYSAGTVVPVIEATNQPENPEGTMYFIDTDELKDDCYGILIGPGEYEHV